MVSFRRLPGSGGGFASRAAILQDAAKKMQIIPCIRVCGGV